MAISNLDKFLHVGNPGTATTLASPGYTIGNTSITVASTTNFPTDTGVIFSIDTASTTTGSQVRNQNSYCVFFGVITGAQTIGSLQLLSGTPQNYAASALTRVYITVSAIHMNRLVDGILTFANQDGSLKQTAVKTALGVSSTTGGGWDILNAGTAPTVATGYNKGNKEFALTFNGVDLTSTLSAGMRLKFDRGTTAPTQSMSFTAASSQYATKASPTGITFTSAFTCEAWVYVTAYPTGSQGASIIGRTDTLTGGFQFRLNTSGQVSCYYSGSSSFTEFVSYQSIPLNRWVHVAASVSSVASKTGTVYINGVSVPNLVAPSAATTLVQTSNLSVGGAGAGVANSFFNGYISEARVWSVAQTTTQIQDNMAISLTGSETNLVALFQGNGNFNDKTANANALTSTGGAIATQTANPYNTTEYAIVTKVAYATSTTTVTVFTGTDYNIPLGTLINPFSSYQKSPFGFNADKAKWVVDFHWQVRQSANATNTTTWYNPGPFSLVVPTGGWRLSYQANCITTVATNAAFVGFKTAVSSNSASTTDLELVQTSPKTTTGVGEQDAYVTAAKNITLASQTVYYLLMQATTISGTTTLFAGSTSGGTEDNLITAECSYI